jgi:hypothetical protein
MTSPRPRSNPVHVQPISDLLPLHRIITNPARKTSHNNVGPRTQRTANAALLKGGERVRARGCGASAHHLNRPCAHRAPGDVQTDRRDTRQSDRTALPGPARCIDLVNPPHEQRARARDPAEHADSGDGPRGQALRDIPGRDLRQGKGEARRGGIRWMQRLVVKIVFLFPFDSYFYLSPPLPHSYPFYR